MCAEELTAPFHNREDDDGEDDGESSDASGSCYKEIGLLQHNLLLMS